MHAHAQSPAALAEIGETVARLGAAVDAGTTLREDAVAELVALTAGTPGWLSPQGASGQLAAWRSARSRYTGLSVMPACRPANARTLGVHGWTPKAGA